jgi:syntaxin 5
MGDGSPGRSNKGKGRAQNGDVLALDLGAAEEGSSSQNGGGAFMQMQLVEQQVSFRTGRISCPNTNHRTVIYKHGPPL